MKKLRFLFIFILALMLGACGQAAPAATQAGIEPTLSGSAVQTVANKKMTLTFAFGEREGTYTGETVNGLPHGSGIFISSNTKT